MHSKPLNQVRLRASVGTLALSLLMGIPGCTNTKPNSGIGVDDKAAAGSTSTESNTARTDNPASAKNAAAFIYGRQVNWNDLLPSLVETAGGQVIVDRVLDIGVEAKLAQNNLKISDEQIAFERKSLGETLSDDPNTAARLLAELRSRRGLGDARFTALLKRQAGLRVLVQNEILITDAGLQQAYQALHGPRYEIRLITVNSLMEATEAQRRIAAGGNFMDVAIAMSTDSSRAQGGLLSPLSPADPTYPEAIRFKLSKLKPGEVSDAIALAKNYAIIKLERRIEGDGVSFDSVKEQTTAAVRRMLETQAIQRLKKELLQRADIVIMDAALKRGWEDQLERITKETTSF